MNQKLKSNYILHHLIVGVMETNCYIFGSAKTKEVAVIDPGADYERIKEILDREALTPKFIINTHGHIDHTGANCKFGLPIYIHKKDANFLTNPLLSLSAFYSGFATSPKANRLLEENDELELSDIKLKVIHTPGHTPGGISLHYDGIVFTGDALFNQGIGRTDLPYSNSRDLTDAICNKLFKLNDDVIVLPGHGPQTTIGAEKSGNPWL